MPPASEDCVPAAFRTPQTSKNHMTPPTSHESTEYRMNVDRGPSRDRRIRPSPGFSSDDDRSLSLEDVAAGDPNTLITSPPGALDAHLRSEAKGGGRINDIRKDAQSMGDIDAIHRPHRRYDRNHYDDARSLGDIEAARRRTHAVLRSNARDGYGASSSPDFDDVKSMGDLSKVSMDTQQLTGLTPQELARIRLRKQQKMAMRRQAEKIEGEQFDQPDNSLAAFLSQNKGYESDDVASQGGHSYKSSDNDTFTDMFKWSLAVQDDAKPSASKSVGAATAPASFSKRSGSIGAASRSTTGGASRRSSTRRRSSSAAKRRGSRSVGAPVERRKSRSGGLHSQAPDMLQRPGSNSYADGLYTKGDDSLRGIDQDELDKIQAASALIDGGRQRLQDAENSRLRSRSTKSSRRSKSAAHADSRSRRSRRDQHGKKSKATRPENKSSRSERGHRSTGRSRREDDGSIGSSKRSSSKRRKSSGAVDKAGKRSVSRQKKTQKNPKSPAKSRSSEDDRSKTSREKKENRKSSRSKSSRRTSDDDTRRSSSSKVKRSKSKKRTSRADAVLTSPTSVDRPGYDSTYDSQYDTTNEGGFRADDASFSTHTKDTDADNSGRSNANQKSDRRGRLAKADSEESIEAQQEILLQFHPCTPGNTERMNISTMNSSFVKINNCDGSSIHRMILEMPSTADQTFPPDRNYSDSRTVSSVASVSKMASDGSTFTETPRGRGRKKMIGVVQGAKDLMDRARSKSRGTKGRKGRARSRSLRKSVTESTKSSSGETQACSDEDDEAQLLSGRMSSCESEDVAPATPRRRRSGVGIRSRTKTQ